MKQIILGVLIAMIMLLNIILRRAVEKDANDIVTSSFILLVVFLGAALYVGGF